VTPRLPAPAAERLRRFVTERTGLDFAGPRQASFLATLDRDARAAGAADPEDHAEALLAGRAPLGAFVEEPLGGLTEEVLPLDALGYLLMQAV
jgi:hypothetical protein